MLVLSKAGYKKCLIAGQFADSSLWTFIFIYTQLHLARTITDEHRALAGIFECLVGLIALTILRRRKVIELATKNLMFIQVVDLLSSVATRFLVVSFPATYMSIVSIRNSIISKMSFTAFTDLENKLYSGEERTDLELGLDQGHAGGALIGSGIAWIVVGVHIETVCWIAVSFCFISYGYEMWLGCSLKQIVRKDKEKKEKSNGVLV